MVIGLLVLLLLVVPIAELYVIVQVAGGIGVPETILLLIVISVVGAWLVRREGIGLMRRIQAQLSAGQMPAREVVDGGLILFAGALMLTPGFLTDCLGLVLLVPPSRAVVRTALLRRFRHRITVVGANGSRTSRGRGRVVDVDATEAEPRRDRPELDGP